VQRLVVEPHTVAIGFCGNADRAVEAAPQRHPRAAANGLDRVVLLRRVKAVAHGTRTITKI
jgi:hypothetical protein